MSTTRILRGIGGALALAVLAGCTAGQPSPEVTTTPESTHATPPEASASPWDYDTYEPVEQTAPTASPAQLAEVATHFIKVYGADYDSHEQWWDNVAPLVAEGQAEKFRSVGSDALAQIDLTITGEVTIAAQSSPFVARASVPTAAGTVHLVMSCPTQGEPWVVESMSR